MNEEIDLYADVDKVHSSDFQEVHQTREPISKLVRITTTWPASDYFFKVSIYIGNLTWWTSDLDIEQHIRKNGITDLVEVSSEKTKWKKNLKFHLDKNLWKFFKRSE